MAIIVAQASAGESASRWHAGDALTYDVTIELQQHSVPRFGSAAKEKTQESTSAGTAVFVVDGVGANGDARAKGYITFQGSGGGRLGRMAGMLQATILSDGEINVTGLPGAEMTKAFALADETIRDASGHQLRTGAAWQTSLALTGTVPRITVVRVVGVQRRYLGYPTFEIGTSGTAAMQTPTQTGKLSLTSLVYYDPQDRIFVAASVRNFALLLNKTGGHTESTAIVNIALRSVSARGAASSTPRLRHVATPVPTLGPAQPYAPATAAPISGATTGPTVYPMGASPLPTVTP